LKTSSFETFLLNCRYKSVLQERK